MTFHILVADRHVLRVLRYQPRERVLEELATYLNADARLNRRDLLADREGRVVNGPAGIRQAYAPPADAGEHSMQRWLRGVCRAELPAVCGSLAGGVVLVAQARLLAQLRAQLGRKERAPILAELPRNLARLPVPVLHKRLEPILRAALQAWRERALRRPARRRIHPAALSLRP